MRTLRNNTLGLLLKQRRRISAQREVMEQDRERQRYETRLERRLRGMFRTYGERAAEEYEDSGVTTSSDAALPVMMERVLHPHYRQVIPFFGRRTFAMLQKQDERFFRQLAEQYIFTQGANAIVRASATTRGLVRALIANGIAAGDGIEVIARRIQRTLASGSVPRLRARVIARTETHGSATFASNETAKSLNIPELRKRWVAITAGGRTRPSHLAVNGTTIGMDERFSVSHPRGVDLMDRPGDPSASAANIIQCRCALVYVEPDAVVSA